jgi:hypothetical protein
MNTTNRPALCRYLAAIAVITVEIVLSSACGGGGSSQSMSATQAQAVSQEFASAVEAALQTSITTEAQHNRQGLGAVLSSTISQAIKRETSPADSSGCVTSVSGTSCNYPVSYSGSCPQGGKIGVTGNFDFTLNNSGDGSDSTSLTITPTNCAVSNLTINGNPNVTFATQITFQDDNLAYPITLSETGGISYGPNPSGSCTVNATLTITSAQSCTVSGTICGQTLSGSCTQLPPNAER